jgi:hypothetical protein
MQATAGQIYSEFENSLVSIVTEKGEQFVARITSVTGGIQIGSKPTIPESTFLEIDRFIDPRPYSRPNLTYDFSVQVIHPNDITEIQKYIPGT